ncbi:LacI family DNA-binding transcriptional regulator [Marinoscillum sp.]|uniref:LacI family DNA-binding transcriptional regulator n=1 Tax=Marinoscillum sp. TaxID=2024838 RepID=UPI003BA9392C
MSKIATIKDVALALGVSTSTVSRILNGKNQSNQELVEKVHAVAKKLNYQVNTTARGLRTSKSGLIGIIVPDISDDFFASVFAGIEEVTEAEGYNLLICQSNESKEKEQQLVKSLIACNVEGLMIAVTQETEETSFLDDFANMGKKVVMFDRVIRQNVYPVIETNDFDGTYNAGKQLIDRGGKNFLYVGLFESLENNRQRLGGYEAVLKENSLKLQGTVYVEDLHRTAQILDTHWNESIDTILCYNDMIAAETLAYFNERGLKVPEQVSVCGFDNRPLCRYTHPTLTSVVQPTKRLGALATHTLLGLINETDVEPMELENDLIVRGSTR